MLGYSLAGLVVGLAVGADLLYASISKAFAVTLHGRNGSVDWSIVGWLSVGSVPAALLAVLFLQYVGPGPELDRIIKVALGLAVVLTAAGTLLRDRLLRFAKSDRFAWLRRLHEQGQRGMTIAAGVLIGAFVAISSVGAGVIGMMILLLLYPRHPAIKLVGSDLAHAVIITGIAGLGHAGLGTVNYTLLGYLLVGAIPGIWLGTRVGFRLPDRKLRPAIAALLLFVGAGMLTKAIAAQF